MDQRIRLYWTLLIINIVLTSIALVLVIYFISSPKWIFTTIDISLTVLPLFVFLVNSGFILVFIKNKYPVKSISNKIEGFTYLFGILSFVFAAMVLFIQSVIINSILENGIDKFRSMLFYVSVPSIFIAITSVILNAYSFHVIKIIRGNLAKLAHQIKNIGEENEAMQSQS